MAAFVNMELGPPLFSESQIARAVEEIAAEIGERYDLSDLVLVGAMDGAVCFLADLMRALGEPVRVTTVGMSSYEGAGPGDIEVMWMARRERIEGRDVLIVEDIVDTGATCALLSERLAALGARSVRICALLDKPSRRTHDVEVDYFGFKVPDVFVVGYGLDYDGAFRNLPAVYALGTAQGKTDPAPRTETVEPRN